MKIKYNNHLVYENTLYKGINSNYASYYFGNVLIIYNTFTGKQIYFYLNYKSHVIYNNYHYEQSSIIIENENTTTNNQLMLSRRYFSMEKYPCIYNLLVKYYAN